MVTQADWLVDVRDTGNVSPEITDAMLTTLSANLALEYTRKDNIFFLMSSHEYTWPAGEWEVDITGGANKCYKPTAVFRVSAGARVDIEPRRQATFQDAYPYKGHELGPPISYIMFGEFMRVGPTPAEETDITIEGFYHSYSKWFDYAPDVLKWATLAGLTAYQFESESLPVWAGLAADAYQGLLTAGRRRSDMDVVARVGSKWRS